MAKGRHIFVDGFVPIEYWPNSYDLLQLLLNAAEAGGATILDSKVIELPHPEKSRSDSPVGGTAWIGLDESHVTAHWYEHETEVEFAFDSFTCGSRADPRKIWDFIYDSFDSHMSVHIRSIDRLI